MKKRIDGRLPHIECLKCYQVHGKVIRDMMFLDNEVVIRTDKGIIRMQHDGRYGHHAEADTIECYEVDKYRSFLTKEEIELLESGVEEYVERMREEGVSEDRIKSALRVRGMKV